MLLDRQYWKFCTANPDLWFERSAAGEAVIRPPAGAEASQRNLEILGNVSGPTAQFGLPDGWALTGEPSNQLAGKGTVAPHRAARDPRPCHSRQHSHPRAGSVVRAQSRFVLQLRTIWEGLK
jgi:hypothetical protein